jgi:hypothetical protein
VIHNDTRSRECYVIVIHNDTRSTEYQVLHVFTYYHQIRNCPCTYCCVRCEDISGSVQQDQQDALFAFSLLQLIACTCFEHLFTHHQEVLYIQQLVYCVCVLCWVAASTVEVELLVT